MFSAFLHYVIWTIYCTIEYMTKLKALEKKIEEIGKAAEKKFTKAEAQECKSFEKVAEKAESAENVFSAAKR